MNILVLGFGTFGDVPDNPSASLARAVHGRAAGPATLHGFEMPVSYRRSHALTLERVQALRPALVLGIGVAVNRPRAMVEGVAVNRVAAGRPDVDGHAPRWLGDGPDTMASADAWLLSIALGVDISPDAGRYVCNAWLYQSLRSRLRAGFLHVPATGFDSESLVDGLGRMAAVTVGFPPN